MRRSGGHPVALPVCASVVVCLLLAPSLVGLAFGADMPVRREPRLDMQLAAKVRKALKEDKQLDLLKLRITVQDRIVTLEGNVVSEQQLRAAAGRVEKVPGVAEVRTTLVKVVALKNEIDLTIPLQLDPPTRTETLYTDRGSSVIARPTALPRIAGPIPEIVSVRLEPPIPLPPPPDAESGTTLRTPIALTAEEVVSVTVERVRQGNPRFRLLSIEVRGDLVWLRGNVEQLDAGMEFARALNDLGVRHVVVQCTLRIGR